MAIVCSTSNLNNIDKGSPTNYQLIFPLIPSESSIGVNNPFVMNIHSAMLPSITLASEELRWQGNKTRRGLIPMEFDPWLVSFVVDSRLDNWKLLFKWMSYINNNNDKISEYHNRYSVDCSLVVTSNYGIPIMEVIFVGIWPSNIQEVSFSQREGDILLESAVSFSYDYFYVRDTTWPIGFSSSSQSSSSRSSVI